MTHAIDVVGRPNSRQEVFHRHAASGDIVNTYLVALEIRAQLLGLNCLDLMKDGLDQTLAHEIGNLVYVLNRLFLTSYTVIILGTKGSVTIDSIAGVDVRQRVIRWKIESMDLEVR